MCLICYNKLKEKKIFQKPNYIFSNEFKNYYHILGLIKLKKFFVSKTSYIYEQNCLLAYIDLLDKYLLKAKYIKC